MNKISQKLNLILRQEKMSLDDHVFVENCLADEDLLVRSLAVRIVGRFRIERLLPKLIDSLSTGGEKMSFPDAVATFGKKVIPLLKEKLTQKTNTTFRKNVAFVLGKIGTEESKDILMELVEDKSPKVRRVSILELSYIVDKKKNSILLQQLLKREKDETVRFLIEKVISKLGK